MKNTHATPIGYADVKALTKRIDIPTKEAIVLDYKNDPYFSGSKAHTRDAKWFADLWNTNDFGTKHLRRVHYAAHSRASVYLPNGKLYVNEEKSNYCWDFLCQAARHARYQGRIDPDSVIDKRNDDLKFHSDTWFDEQPEHEFEYDDEWSLPLPDGLKAPELDIEEPSVTGYGYDHSSQEHLLVLFVEKSTMSDILIPICEEYGIVYIEGEGYTSVTRIRDLLKLARRMGKRVRIFYVSDYDKAGRTMPISTARQLGFWADKERYHYPFDYDDPDDDDGYMDVRLDSICLTAEQIEQYDLPSTTDSKGRACVELDALEALYPGEFRKIVTRTIEPYFDKTLPARLRTSSSEALDDIDEQWSDHTESLRDERDDLQERIKQVYEKHTPALLELTSKMRKDLKPLEAEMKELLDEINESRDNFSPDMPDRPSSNITTPDTDGWLYESERDYMEQVDILREAKP